MSGGFSVLVRVLPGSRRKGIGGAWTDENGRERLVIRVAAPPEDGKANKAVCAAIAGALGLSKSAVAITAGEKSRLKTVSVDAAETEALRARLGALMMKDGK